MIYSSTLFFSLIELTVISFLLARLVSLSENSWPVQYLWIVVTWSELTAILFITHLGACFVIAIVESI